MFGRLASRIISNPRVALRTVSVTQGLALSAFTRGLASIAPQSQRSQQQAKQQSFWRSTSVTVGIASGLAGLATLTAAVADDASKAAPAVDTGVSADKFQPLPLTDKEALNDNSNIYVFTTKAPVDMTVASFFMMRATMDGKEVARPYTPIKVDGNRVFFLVKTYPEGKLSKHLAALNPGDTVEFKGPIKKIDVKPNFKKEIGLVAGGSGITPIYQVVDYLLANADSNTKIKLIYANVAEKDIWLKEYFDRAAQSSPDKFAVHYVLEKPPAGWTGSTGYVQKELLKSFLPAPSKDSLIMVCGPPPMMNHISGNKAPDYSQGEVSGLLKELGYDKDTVFKF